MCPTSPSADAPYSIAIAASSIEPIQQILILGKAIIKKFNYIFSVASVVQWQKTSSGIS
jgi:hypothetical protein